MDTSLTVKEKVNVPCQWCNDTKILIYSEIMDMEMCDDCWIKVFQQLEMEKTIRERQEIKECWQCKAQVKEQFDPKIELNDVKIYYCIPCIETIAQEYTRFKLMQLEQEKQMSRRNISQGRIIH